MKQNYSLDTIKEKGEHEGAKAQNVLFTFRIPSYDFKGSIETTCV